MANYYATTRSNYFRVTDAKAFEAWCRKRDLEFWTKEFPEVGVRYAISANEGDGSGWSHYELAEDEIEEKEIDVVAELAKHLDPRDVAVLVEIGSEKLRYLVGVATAVSHDGQRATVDLEEIYDRAIEFFKGDFIITDATY